MRFFKIDQFFDFRKVHSFLFEKMPGAQFLDPFKGGGGGGVGFFTKSLLEDEKILET